MASTDPANLDRVYRYLRQSIITGDLRAGTRLVEDRLSEELEVSRTPVREAIQRLISDGLVIRVRRGQVEVRYVSQEERAQLHELRLAFDEVAARALATKAKEIDWDSLYARLDPIAAAIEAGGLTSTDLAIAHLELHLALNEVAFGHTVSTLVMGHGFLYIIDPAVQPADYDPVREHRILLDDLRTGDVDIAVKAMRNHAILKVA
jgi:DNA-binding GntR family transcriptional regulator